MTHRIEIRYCVKCRWLLRSAWMAQELLSTFEDELDELALVQARMPSSKSRSTMSSSGRGRVMVDFQTSKN